MGLNHHIQLLTLWFVCHYEQRRDEGCNEHYAIDLSPAEEPSRLYLLPVDP